MKIRVAPFAIPLSLAVWGAAHPLDHLARVVQLREWKPRDWEPAPSDWTSPVTEPTPTAPCTTVTTITTITTMTTTTTSRKCWTLHYRGVISSICFTGATLTLHEPTPEPTSEVTATARPTGGSPTAEPEPMTEITATARPTGGSPTASELTATARPTGGSPTAGQEPSPTDAEPEPSPTDTVSPTETPTPITTGEATISCSSFVGDDHTTTKECFTVQPTSPPDA